MPGRDVLADSWRNASPADAQTLVCQLKQAGAGSPLGLEAWNAEVWLSGS